MSVAVTAESAISFRLRRRTTKVHFAAEQLRIFKNDNVLLPITRPRSRFKSTSQPLNRPALNMVSEATVLLCGRLDLGSSATHFEAIYCHVNVFRAP
jgi:hypothetical protein